MMGYSKAQNKVENNGYNKFYYPSGQVSSEGMMVDGNPDGFWKTYYATGIIKSEGYRRNLLLDSIWIFYDEKGDTLEKINFYQGKKNGFYFTYKYKTDINGKKTGGLVSKELFLDDIRQGLSYYFEEGKLNLTINYVKGKKHGISREFDGQGSVITIYEYKNDYLVYKEKINRKDNKGFKQGTWKEYFQNDKIKREINYINDTLNGYYKEFDENGKMVHLFKYKDGKKLNIDSVKEVNVFVKEEYYDNGKLKYKGSYIDSIPVGLHKYFSKDGSVQTGMIYNEIGKLLGEGLVDDNEKKQGSWKFYYESGELLSRGRYLDDKRIDEWLFYYRNGNLEEKGKYIKGNPVGEWNWFHENGNIWRIENYENGKEEGSFVEFAPDSSVINKGEYVDGEKEGFWFYHVGDHTEEGNYQGGLKEGLWKYYYSNGLLFFIGNFVHDLPNGRHKYFWDNGNLREQGNYSMGNKEGIWVKYDFEGNVEMTTTFKNDNEEKVNGVKMTLPKERKQ